ncbi:MAG: hypothetical protein WKF37_07370 [Bryobacteraceae bacterium]
MRGAREYSLDLLLDNMMAAQLLRREGDDSIRFTYTPLQSYFCALSFADHIAKTELQDIVASLGRIGHLRWWEDTLLLYAGLNASPEFLESLVFGSSLHEGEQAFPGCALSERCHACR